jgi:outer membrane receptor protein involved in Fe transport
MVRSPCLGSGFRATRTTTTRLPNASGLVENGLVSAPFSSLTVWGYFTNTPWWGVSEIGLALEM